jgi:hypothetical protein
VLTLFVIRVEGLGSLFTNNESRITKNPKGRREKWQSIEVRSVGCAAGKA